MPAIEALTMTASPKRAKLAKKPTPVPDEQTPHKCIACGSTYPKQPGYFPKLGLPTVKANNFFSPFCNTCVTQRYLNWITSYDGNRVKAIRRCCEWLDTFYKPDVAEKATDVLDYLKQLQRFDPNGAFKRTWDDTLEEEAKIVDSTINNPIDLAEGRSPLIEEGISVFGEGFPEDAYPMMLRTYHGYIDPLGDTVTAGQLKSARFLAALEYRCMEAIKADKPNASALSSSLTKAIKESGFDTVQPQDSASEENTYGMWLAEIEEYTPAEYVKKHPYRDIDNYDRYYERFVRRSVENLLNRASQKQDDELSISDEEARTLDAGDNDDAT